MPRAPRAFVRANLARNKAPAWKSGRSFEMGLVFEKKSKMRVFVQIGAADAKEAYGDEKVDKVPA